MKGVLKVSENLVIEMSGRKLTKKPCNSLLFFELQGFVEIPRFELGQTEPKSVVLPLHHISLYIPLPSPIVGEVATFAPSKTFFESPGPVAASDEALFAAQRYFFF